VCQWNSYKKQTGGETFDVDLIARTRTDLWPVSFHGVVDPVADRYFPITHTSADGTRTRQDVPIAGGTSHKDERSTSHR